MKRLFVLLFCLPALGLFGTHGYFQVGYGAKAKGMAGIGIAYPQDAFAAFSNPAGLSCVGNRLDVGLHWFRHQGAFRTYTNPPDPVLLTELHTRGCLWWPEGAVNLCLGGGMTAGLGAVVAGEWDVDYGRGLNGELDDPVRSQFRTIYVTPSWSWRFSSCMAFGIALNVALSRLRLMGLRKFEEGSLADSLVTNNGWDWETGVSVRFGWIGRLRCVQAGVTYQTKTWNGLFRKYRGFVPQGSIDLPSQFGVGGAWWITPCFVLSMEATKVFWTDGRWFRNDPVGEDGAPFGALDGPGLGWRDQLVARMGAAWQATGSVTVRAGISHGNTPVGRGDTYLNLLTLETIEEHLTLGLTWVCGRHELSVDYVYALHHTAAGFNEHPEPDVYVELSEHQHSVGLSYGMRF